MTPERLARSPPAFRWIDGDVAATGQLRSGTGPDVLVERAAMALAVAKQAIRIFGIDRVIAVLAPDGGVDPRYEVFRGRVQGTLNVKTKAV